MVNKVLRAALALTLLGVLALAAFLRISYGGGRPYPDLSGPPLVPESALEVVVTSPEPIGNVAVAEDGRVFYTIHPESRPEGAKLLVWQDGRATPYPSESAQKGFDTILGVAIDRQNRLWTIDHGTHGLRTPRLLAFDLATGSVSHDHAFPRAVAPLGSFLQDLQIDSKGETVYLADVSFWGRKPALVVYDVATRRARRVLERDASTGRQRWLVRNPIKDMRFFGGLLDLSVGVDGIAISKNDEWIAYGAMTHDTLYRVPTQDLKNATLSPAELAAKVQAVGRKPLNDGLSTDVAGNVLITDVEHGAVLRMSPDGSLETLVKSPRIRWADALSYGPGGFLYVADSAIPHQMLRSRAHIARSAPYFIYRFAPGIDGVPGQ